MHLLRALLRPSIGLIRQFLVFALWIYITISMILLLIQDLLKGEALTGSIFQAGFLSAIIFFAFCYVKAYTKILNQLQQR